MKLDYFLGYRIWSNEVKDWLISPDGKYYDFVDLEEAEQFKKSLNKSGHKQLKVKAVRLY